MKQHSESALLNRRKVVMASGIALCGSSLCTPSAALAQQTVFQAALRSTKFNAAIAAMRADFSADPMLVERGQFYVTTRNAIELDRQFEAAFDASPEARALGLDKARALEALRALHDAAVQRALHPSFEPLIDALLLPLGGRAGGLGRFFTRSGTEAAWAKSAFDNVWNTTAIPPAATTTFASPTIYKSNAAYKLEADRCFLSSSAMANKLIARRGLRRPAAPINSGRLANVSAAGDNFTIVGYASPAALAAEVGKISAALNVAPGAVVRVGVLSGLNDQGRIILGLPSNRLPNPEHYLLLLAHESIGGKDCFLFWDPDAAVTNLQPSWGSGFGLLFHEPGRFRTAFDDSDDAPLQVTPEGKHASSGTRKRYQVLSAISLPP